MSKKHKKKRQDFDAVRTLKPASDVLGAPLDAVKKGEVEKSLSAIFLDADGKAPDMSRLERRRSHLALLILGGGMAFLGLLIVAAWAGFAIFKPFRGFTGQGLNITIDGPEKVVLGEETTYFINYVNASAQPLAAADFRINFPVDFSPTALEPEPTGPGMYWRIGAIEYGGRGTVKVKGFFSGALGTKTALQVVGNFRPASFNSDFEALAAKQLEYSDSILKGWLELPVKALPGDKIKIIYHLENAGMSALKKLEARITLPHGFVRDATSTAQLDESTVSLPVGELANGASTTVALTGSFAAGISGDQTVHAEAGALGPDGAFMAAQKTDAILPVLAGDLSLKLVANGSDQGRSIAFGDVLHFGLGYENTSSEELKDVVLRVTFEPIYASSTTPPKTAPKFLDWAHLENFSSGTIAGNELAWDGAKLELLRRMTPQQDGMFEFSLPVMRSVSSTSLIGFRATASASIKSVGSAVLNRLIRAQPLEFRFRSDVKLGSEARYFSEEGAPLGSGPLPPVVGQATTYRVIWDISKTIHELKSIKVSAVLPNNVVWPGKSDVTAGNLDYDPNSRQVSWILNRLPSEVSSAEAEFDVQLTPSLADAGRFAQLLGDVKFESTDAAIGEKITILKPGLSTDLQNDDGAKSKGVVRKP